MQCCAPEWFEATHPEPHGVRFVLGAAIVLGFAGTALPAPAAPSVTIPFATYGSPYFVRNDFEPGARRSYVVIRTWSAFHGVFGVGVTMNGPAPAIAPSTFRSKMLLVAIARGPLCTFGAPRVTRSAADVQLAYALQCPAPSSASYAVPLIVAIDRSPAAVGFVENGRPVDVVPGAP